MSKAKAGIIGIVGDEAKVDFWGSMKRLAEIGYGGVEAPGHLYTGDVESNVKRFYDLGLQVLTITALRERLQTDLPGVIQEAKALKSSRVSCWWAPCDSRESILKDAALYNSAGKALVAEGIKLCYHHHAHELTNVFNGVTALDILAEHTDPAAVFFTLDIAWLTFGGADASAVIRRLASRTPSIHVKDLVPDTDDKAHFTAVGTGSADVYTAVRTAIDAGIEWAVVEQDHLRNLTAWETATVSYLNLKEAGLV